MKVYGSIRNGGDGSASITWYENRKLAVWDQEHLFEGWGEECIEQIEFTGDPLFEIQSAEAELLEKYFGEDDDFEDFKKKFFKIIPKFTVDILNDNYYGIYLNNKLIYKQFQYPGKTNEIDLNKTIEFLNQLK